MDKRAETISRLCDKLKDKQFVDRHKSFPTAFTRLRKLSFMAIFILILRNSVKSLQLILNEFVLDTKKGFSITAGAFTKARKKLKHTAYIELNNDVIEIYYQDKNIKRLHSYRILAFDGSRITLPKNAEIEKEFGSRPIGNHTGKDLGAYCRATYQACFDVLNQIAVKSIIGHWDAYEPDLVNEMTTSLDTDDLFIFDRGYASYSFMANLLKQQKHFIIRCPKVSFIAVQNMFNDDAPASSTVLIEVPLQHKRKVRELGLPNTIKLRLIRIVLSSGEIEVLATSLEKACVLRLISLSQWQ